MNLVDIMDSLTSSLVDQGTNAVANTVEPQQQKSRKGLLSDLLDLDDDEPVDQDPYRRPRQARSQEDDGRMDGMLKVKNFFFQESDPEEERKKKKQKDFDVQRTQAKKRVEDMRQKYHVKDKQESGTIATKQPSSSSSSSGKQFDTKTESSTSKPKEKPESEGFLSSWSTYLGIGGSPEKAPEKESILKGGAEEDDDLVKVTVRPKRSPSDAFKDDLLVLSDSEELLATGIPLHESGTEKGKVRIVKFSPEYILMLLIFS